MDPKERAGMPNTMRNHDAVLRRNPIARDDMIALQRTAA